MSVFFCPPLIPQVETYGKLALRAERPSVGGFSGGCMV
jgi:hypothetical protein